MMQAATEGALQAGRPVGGIRIAREAGTTVRSGSYLPENVQVRDFKFEFELRWLHPEGLPEKRAGN